MLVPFEEDSPEADVPKREAATVTRTNYLYSKETH